MNGGVRRLKKVGVVSRPVFVPWEGLLSLKLVDAFHLHFKCANYAKNTLPVILIGIEDF